MHKSSQGGFTLIELMIVVAIVGILAAIAIPAYQDYVTRSKVTEIVSAAAACKTSIAEYFASKGNLPTNVTFAGCSTTRTQYLTRLTVTAGVITATARSSGVGGFNRGQIFLTPNIVNNELVSWNCTSTPGRERYVPASCRS